jgi:hypothetical protein
VQPAVRSSISLVCLVSRLLLPTWSETPAWHCQRLTMCVGGGDHSLQVAVLLIANLSWCRAGVVCVNTGVILQMARCWQAFTIQGLLPHCIPHTVLHNVCVVTHVLHTCQDPCQSFVLCRRQPQTTFSNAGKGYFMLPSA